MEDTVVLYPAPGIGHMISMLELARLILSRYGNQLSTIHILITTGFRDIEYTYLDHVSRTNPSIIFHHFPFIQVDFTPTRSMAAIAFEFIRLNASNAHHALQEISKTSTIRAFVIDFFCTSALPCATELGIPTYYFFTSGAAALAAYLYFPTIHKQISRSFKDLFHIQLHMPGLPSIPTSHMPEPVLIRDDPAYEDILYFSGCLAKSSGILVNTFDELEPVAMKAITDGSCVPDCPTPPVYNIGPLIAGADNTPAEDNNIDAVVNKDDCLSWLDRQPEKSVVFLCFGSRGSFPAEQVKEIANGLERSGQRFLWVVKKPPADDKTKQASSYTDFDIGSLMPEGFLERTKNRGLAVKSWVPQLQVLKHAAVGGFVSHCGWNSTLEAVIEGVPLVAWPLHAEQHINEAALVHDMKMALPLEHRADGSVTAEEVEKRIRELMDSERGRELKKRSQKMRYEAFSALGNSGSSTTALAKLVKVWFKC